MSVNKRILAVLALATVLLLAGCTGQQGDTSENQKIKIGVATALSGNYVFWGQSTVSGAELAQKELKSEGINVELVFEDGGLDAQKYVNSIQKLVDVDNVDALYNEFAPGARATSSVVGGKEVLTIYNAAPVKPLESGDNIFKSFVDYRRSCKATAQELKDRGVEKIGMLKINLNFGPLCLEGLKEVYGDNVYVESYNPKTSSFKTRLTKLKQEGVGAVFNPSFPPQTSKSFKEATELGMNATLISTSDAVTKKFANQNPGIMEDVWVFGLPKASESFKNKINNEFPDKDIGNMQAAAQGYIHIKQLANSLADCDKEISCAKKQLSNAGPEELIDFNGFQDRIAQFDIFIQKWENGEFVPLEE